MHGSSRTDFEVRACHERWIQVTSGSLGGEPFFGTAGSRSPDAIANPCIVRNFSIEGALLEFKQPPPQATRFFMSIDAYNFSIECYVRHRSKTGIGVYFVEPAEGEWPRGQVSPKQVVDMIRAELRD